MKRLYADTVISTHICGLNTRTQFGVQTQADEHESVFEVVMPSSSWIAFAHGIIEHYAETDVSESFKMQLAKEAVRLGVLDSDTDGSDY